MAASAAPVFGSSDAGGVDGPFGVDGVDGVGLTHFSLGVGLGELPGVGVMQISGVGVRKLEAHGAAVLDVLGGADPELVAQNASATTKPASEAEPAEKKSRNRNK